MPLAIKGFLETSFRDWDGLISAVVFLPGCNWRCFYCHNHPLVFQPEQFPDIAEQQVFATLEKYRDWLDGLVVGGGEPTLHAELFPFLEKVKKLGFRVKLDTNGSQPEVIRQLLEKKLVDYFAIDLKAPLEENIYAEVCQVKVFLDKIKQTMLLISNAYQNKLIDYEYRTTLAPPFFSEEAIAAMCREISGAPRYVLQQFDPTHVREEDKRKLKPYSSAEVEKWAQKAREYIKFVSIREG